MKVFSIQTGFGIMSDNKIVVKKLTSSGKIDQTYKPCETVSTLRDVIYDIRNSGLIFALTETSNELLLFKLLTGKGDCQATGKLALSDVIDRPIFDQVSLFGPLLVARNIEDASLHLFMDSSSGDPV